MSYIHDYGTRTKKQAARIAAFDYYRGKLDVKSFISAVSDLGFDNLSIVALKEQIESKNLTTLLRVSITYFYFKHSRWMHRLERSEWGGGVVVFSYISVILMNIVALACAFTHATQGTLFLLGIFFIANCMAWAAVIGLLTLGMLCYHVYKLFQRFYSYLEENI